MAGNIIPAIATTNAIIAGFVVMQATNLLARNLKKARKVFLKANPAFPLGLEHPAQPDPACGVCRDTYVSLKADPSKLTLGTFVSDIVQKWLVSDANDGDDDDELEFYIYEGGRLLADPDFDDNFEKTLESLDVGRGKVITVRDEDSKYRPVQFYLTAL
jgi:ubiquitin-like 1-activating enzyme E1 B